MRRQQRLNSLLVEVISEVIKNDVKNPDISPLITITRADITKDLKYAKVFFTVIGTKEEEEKTLKALQAAAGFIAIHSSKKVVMRYFPTLTFKVDTSLEKQFRVQELLNEVQQDETSFDS